MSPGAFYWNAACVLLYTFAPLTMVHTPQLDILNNLRNSIGSRFDPHVDAKFAAVKVANGFFLCACGPLPLSKEHIYALTDLRCSGLCGDDASATEQTSLN
jgi:hypothetical protein